MSILKLLRLEWTEKDTGQAQLHSYYVVCYTPKNQNPLGHLREQTSENNVLNNCAPCKPWSLPQPGRESEAFDESVPPGSYELLIQELLWTRKAADSMLFLLTSLLSRVIDTHIEHAERLPAQACRESKRLARLQEAVRDRIVQQPAVQRNHDGGFGKHHLSNSTPSNSTLSLSGNGFTNPIKLNHLRWLIASERIDEPTAEKLEWCNERLSLRKRREARGGKRAISSDEHERVEVRFLELAGKL